MAARGRSLRPPGCGRSWPSAQFLGLLLLSWLPFVVRAVQIYAAANFPQMAFIAPTAETFRQFLDQQDVFVFFVTVYVGAGLIANDRRGNALQIYLSKPLTRAEYVFGKMAILMTFLLMVTWLPAHGPAVRPGVVCRQLRLSSRQSLSVPRHHAVLVRSGCGGVGGDAGAVVAFEQQPVRRHHLCGADFLQCTRCSASSEP